MIIFDFWFLAFAVVFTMSGIFASEFENFLAGTATFIIGLASLQWLFHVPVWESIVENPISVLLYLALYVVAGSIYTLLWRWPEYLRDNSRNINEGYNSFIHSNAKGTREEFFASRYYLYRASNCKENIATWVLTWPFSLSWELLRKPIKYAYRLTYSILGDAFEKVGRSVTNRILNK